MKKRKQTKEVEGKRVVFEKGVNSHQIPPRGTLSVLDEAVRGENGEDLWCHFQGEGLRTCALKVI